MTKRLKKKELASFQKKIDKLTADNIVWGIAGSGEIKSIGWGKRFSIAQLLAMEKGKEPVQKALNKVYSELKEGEILFNKNIPAEMLEMARIGNIHPPVAAIG